MQKIECQHVELHISCQKLSVMVVAIIHGPEDLEDGRLLHSVDHV